MNGILDLKYKLEDQEKIFYSNARMNLTQEEETLEQLIQKKIAYEEAYRRLITQKLEVKEIMQIQMAIDQMKERIKVQQIVVANAQKALEAARARLNKAMSDRKTYEVLKEKAFEQFKRELEATEQKEIDELVSFSYNNLT